jgi:hypothetical protein
LCSAVSVLIAAIFDFVGSIMPENGGMDIFPPAKQRPALLLIAESLDSRSSAPRRDERGDWAIFGTKGHIYAVPVESLVAATFLSPLGGISGCMGIR